MAWADFKEEQHAARIQAMYRRRSAKVARENAIWNPLLVMLEPMAAAGASFDEMMAVAEQNFPHLVPALKTDLGL